MTSLLKSFKPLADERSRILILGSMPGPAALRKKEYYGYPGNHFWRIVWDLFEDPRVAGWADWSYADKTACLRENRIALWDTIHSCTRTGASDSSIRCVKPNDVAGLIRKYEGIRTIFLNGRTSEALYRAHFGGKIHIPAHYLPSTSPAHASLSYAKKFKEWSVIQKYLENRNPWC